MNPPIALPALAGALGHLDGEKQAVGACHLCDAATRRNTQSLFHGQRAFDMEPLTFLYESLKDSAHATSARDIRAPHPKP